MSSTSRTARRRRGWSETRGRLPPAPAAAQPQRTQPAPEPQHDHRWRATENLRPGHRHDRRDRWDRGPSRTRNSGAQSSFARSPCLLRSPKMSPIPPRLGIADQVPCSGCTQPLEMRQADQMRPSEPENCPLRKIRNVSLPNPRNPCGRILRPKSARFSLAFAGPFEPDVGRRPRQIPGRNPPKS
jgi:hypothetical protein